jgi:hypothetical protein
MAQGTKEGRVVTAEESSGSPPTFNWTEEEKSLLRRTLRVRVLEEDRLEVETMKRDLLGDFVLAVFWIGISLLGAIVASGVTTTVVSGTLQVTPLVFVSIPFITFPMMVGFLTLDREPACPITLFPATAWIVSHSPVQNLLGRIALAEESSRPRWGSPIAIATSIGYFKLRVGLGASAHRLRRVQELIFARCRTTMTENAPPRNVADLVGREVASLPKAFYTPLAYYTKLISVTSDTLVIRNGASPSLPWAILSVELVLGGVPACLYPFNILPNVVTLGNLSSLIWYPILGSVLFLTAVIHTVLAYTFDRRHLMRTVILSKQDSYLVYKDHLGESQIPTSECTMSAEVDTREEDDWEPAPTSIEIRHGKKRLVKWVLKDPQPSSEVASALEQGIREYLRAGRQRNRIRPGLEF